VALREEILWDYRVDYNTGQMFGMLSDEQQVQILLLG
jgi:hypothetical protein